MKSVLKSVLVLLLLQAVAVQAATTVTNIAAGFVSAMRGIRPPALFELRAHEWRNAVDSHHTPRSGSPLFSKQVRPTRPVDIPNWSAWGDLHSQGCSGLSRTGLLFPVNHTPVGDPGLAPGRLGDFKSPGSAIPAEASRREMVGMKGIAPPRLPDSESGPSAVRV